MGEAEGCVSRVGKKGTVASTEGRDQEHRPDRTRFSARKIWEDPADWGMCDPHIRAVVLEILLRHQGG